MDKKIMNNILSKSRMKIASFEFEKENIKKTNKNIPKLVATFVITTIVTGGLVYATGNAIYEKISIGWIPTINGLYSLNIENSKYENNEQIITKEEAIRIATERDKKIETRHNIATTEAQIGIDKMNADVVYREKDIENYNKGTINYECDENGTYKIKDNAEFYKVDNRVRKVWEVKIFYDYYNEYYQERYVYYVDATTGEIIGGNSWSGST